MTSSTGPTSSRKSKASGRNDLHAVQSYLTQALLHDLKAQSWPHSRDAVHWRAEARLFRRQARRRFTESMRQRIDLAGLYQDALAGLPDTMDGLVPLPLPAELSVTLDELLAE